MPNIKVNGAELYYEDTGGIGKEVIVFSHSLFLNCRMFDAQVAAFSNRFRCITYDHRGQGQSEVTSSGYDMETVYEDAAQLIRAIDGVPCHFVGVAMGGYIGMRIGPPNPRRRQRFPENARSLGIYPHRCERLLKFTASYHRGVGSDAGFRSVF